MVHHYKGEIKCNPLNHHLQANIILTYHIKEKTSTIIIHLYKNFEISYIQCDKMLTHTYEKEIVNIGPAVPESRKLTINLKDNAQIGDKINIQLAYQGTVEIFPSYETQRITEKYIELGLYTPYFPLTPSFDDATFDFNIKLPEDYELINGDKVDDLWHISITSPHNDCPLIASSKFFKYLTPFDFTIYYIDKASQQVAEEIYQTSGKLLKKYNDLFTPRKTEDPVSLVILPRKIGGAYVRPTLIVYPELIDPNRISLRLLAHEMSHLWWNKAFYNSWEDWLNESFAECTALLMVRQMEGNESFNKMVTEYQKHCQNTPPIYKIQRSNQHAGEVLYMKGPLILLNLEKKIGYDNFINFLKLVHIQEIKTTNNLLELLTKLQGEKIANWLLQQLKTI